MVSMIRRVASPIWSTGQMLMAPSGEPTSLTASLP